MAGSDTLQPGTPRVEPGIGNRDDPVVETIVAGLVAADKQNGLPQRIEREQDTPRPTATLHVEFFHFAVL